MSIRILSIAALAAGFISTGAHAAPFKGPAAFPMMPSPVPVSASQTVVQGQVLRMLINPYGEVDGLRLMDGSIIKFAPHMSDALTAAVRPGDVVKVIGHLHSSSTLKAEAVVNTASGQTVYEQPVAQNAPRTLPPHIRALSLKPQNVEGRIDVVLTGRHGEANGVILADGSIVRFPPDSLPVLVQPGAPFAASGLGTRNEQGTSLEAISVGTTLSALQPLNSRVR